MKEIKEIGTLEPGSSQRRIIYDKNYICPTLQAAMGSGGGNIPLIIHKKPKNYTTVWFLGNIHSPDYGTSYAGATYDPMGIAPTLNTMQGGGRQPYILEPIKENGEVIILCSFAMKASEKFGLKPNKEIFKCLKALTHDLAICFKEQ